MEQFEEEYCCLLKICCGGHGERKAKAALSHKLQTETNTPAAVADVVAAWIIDTFDLAPVNALKAYRDAVAGMAREYPYSE